LFQHKATHKTITEQKHQTTTPQATQLSISQSTQEQAKQTLTEETLVQKIEKWQQDYAMQFCQFSNKKNEQVECYAT
jgi:hypothetical protein